MFDPTYLKVLETGMDAASLRQSVIANNLANIDTPGFKASDVQFENLLAQSLQDGSSLPLATDNPRQIGTPDASDVQPQVVTDNSTSMRSDGNNVDMDQEMTEVAKNNIYYDALTTQLSSQLGILRMVIEGN